MKDICDRKESMRWSGNDRAGCIRSALMQWTAMLGTKEKSGKRQEMKWDM